MRRERASISPIPTSRIPNSNFTIYTLACTYKQHVLCKQLPAHCMAMNMGSPPELGPRTPSLVHIKATLSPLPGYLIHGHTRHILPTARTKSNPCHAWPITPSHIIPPELALILDIPSPSIHPSLTDYNHHSYKQKQAPNQYNAIPQPTYPTSHTPHQIT